MGWIDVDGSRMGKVQVTEWCIVGFKYMVCFKIRCACCRAHTFCVESHCKGWCGVLVPVSCYGVDFIGI
jgi:hypothetical protein